MKFDSTLGWTIKPNSKSSNLLYRSNSEGIRADRNYSTQTPLPGHLRLAAFGDSFTHCDDVANSETWEFQLESIDKHLEVLNFGVGGYGLDQAFLRYRKEGCKFRPRIILIGFMSENINRLVARFRPFYDVNTGIPLSKPRFILHGNQLLLLENPLQTQQDLESLLHDDINVFNKLKIDDYYASCRYSKSKWDFLASIRLMKIVISVFFRKPKHNDGIYDTSSEAYKLTTKLIDEFYLFAESNSSLPVIVLFPTKSDIEMYIKSRKTSYLPLVEYLNNKGYRYIDLVNAFKIYIDNGWELNKLMPLHNSAEANKLIAESIYFYLQSKHLLE